MRTAEHTRGETIRDGGMRPWELIAGGDGKEVGRRSGVRAYVVVDEHVGVHGLKSEHLLTPRAQLSRHLRRREGSGGTGARHRRRWRHGGGRRGGTRSLLRGGRRSLLRGGTRSLLRGGTRSLLRGGTRSLLRGGRRSLLRGGRRSLLRGGRRSLLRGGRRGGRRGCCARGGRVHRWRRGGDGGSRRRRHAKARRGCTRRLWWRQRGGGCWRSSRRQLRRGCRWKHRSQKGGDRLDVCGTAWESVTL
jgi:hypothetical protein